MVALLALVGALVAAGFWYQSAHPAVISAGGERAATISYAAAGILGTSTPVLAVSLDSATQPAGQIAMGATGAGLVTLRFTNVTPGQNINITGLNVFENENAAGQKANFSNVQAREGSTLLGTASAPTLSIESSTPGPGYIYTYHFSPAVVVPASQSISVAIKGDLAAYVSGGATDGSMDSFRVATSTDRGIPRRISPSLRTAR